MMESIAGLVLVIDLGHYERLLEGAFHLDAEPAFDAAGDKLRGDEKKKGGGHKGKGNKGHHQFGLELGPQDFLLPLKDQFDYVPQDEEYQKNQQENVKTDQGDNQKIVREGSLDPPCGNMGLKEEKKPDGGQEDEDQDDLPPFPIDGLGLPFPLSHVRTRVHSLTFFFLGFILFFNIFNILSRISRKSKD
jgi:hypothetical protein